MLSTRTNARTRFATARSPSTSRPALNACSRASSERHDPGPPSIPARPVTGGVVRVGTRFTDAENTIRAPGFVRVDAGASVDISPAWRIQLTVDNFSDTRYIAAGWDSAWEAGIRRRSSVTLTTRF
ncbi:MAG: TonB-dependent receptor [Luteitalea sp.]|nr:TonB-dependent receptor [Luteitalea sp.]